MRIGAYFRQIDTTLTHCPSISLKTILYDERSETQGFIRGLLHFDNGAELHFREFVDVSAGIDRYKYAYHYMRESRLIFRYDNSADITARGFATYPHHKHVGNTIEESMAPSLADVLAEIVETMA